MDQLTYCTKICGSKCCHLHLLDEGTVPCPRLSEKDKSCTVYKKRYAEGTPDIVMVGRWKSRRYKDLDGKAVYRPFWCGRIEQIIANKGLPQEVIDQCCVHRPELLNEVTTNDE
jgi:hypothetical protein